MIKSFANIILIGMLLYSQLYNSLVTVVYQANYDYYAEVLCENKDQPELQCEGKCYFAKQLALDNDRSKEAEPPSFLPCLRLFPSPESTDLTPLLLAESARHFLNWNEILPDFKFQADIEHPPKIQTIPSFSVRFFV